jgi:hypothetical protein
VPVVVWGGQRVLTVGGRWSLRRGRAVTVSVGEPLDPGPDADPYVVTEALRERLARLLADAVDAYPDRPRDDADRWWLPASRGGTAPDVEEGLRLDAAAMARVDGPPRASRAVL